MRRQTLALRNMNAMQTPLDGVLDALVAQKDALLAEMGDHADFDKRHTEYLDLLTKVIQRVGDVQEKLGEEMQATSQASEIEMREFLKEMNQRVRTFGTMRFTALVDTTIADLCPRCAAALVGGIPAETTTAT